jgi:hypothetical protein
MVVPKNILIGSLASNLDICTVFSSGSSISFQAIYEEEPKYKQGTPGMLYLCVFTK